MSDRVILAFAGAYEFLSNFYPSPIGYGGVRYPTVEHAFQAAKTLRSDARLAIARTATPGQAKRLGRRLELRPGWDGMRIGVMHELVELKFAAYPDLMRALLATNGMHLIEGNTWGDTFWGQCGGVGENHLGQILMDIRSKAAS